MIFILILANLQIPSKKWNLEDDSDEEEEGKNNTEKVVEEEEIDPLDAFMQVQIILFLLVHVIF